MQPCSARQFILPAVEKPVVDSWRVDTYQYSECNHSPLAPHLPVLRTLACSAAQKTDSAIQEPRLPLGFQFLTGTVSQFSQQLWAVACGAVTVKG